MQNMNKLAIVIPYYKIDFFEETLKSVAAQTDNRFTLYIGNDASPDDPLPIIKKYFTNHEYQYFDYKDNLGGSNLVAQWKRVLENVTEEWFQILGDDDIISENFVEEFYKNLDNVSHNEINIIKYSQAFINDVSSQITGFTNYKKIISTAEFLYYKFREKHNSCLSEHIFKKSMLNKNIFIEYPSAWHSDDMAVIKSSIPNGIYFIDSAKVFARISSVNISGKGMDYKKQLGSYLFFGDLVKQHIQSIKKNDRLFFIKRYLDLCWSLKKTPQINIYKAYYHAKNIRKLLFTPKTLWKLKQNSRKY